MIRGVFMLKRILLLFFLISIIFTFSACAKRNANANYNKPTISTEGVNKIILRKSPLQGKIVTDSNDISKIIEVINSIEVQGKIPLKPGWTYSINIIGIKKYTIMIMGNSIFIDEDGYTMSEQGKKSFDSLYESLNYKEVKVDMDSELK